MTPAFIIKMVGLAACMVALVACLWLLFRGWERPRGRRRRNP